MLVKVDKAAKILKVSPQTIRRLEKSGKLSSVTTHSGYKLYDTEELAKLKLNRFSAAETYVDSSSLTILKAAQFLGVSSQTLRRWELSGKIISKRTPSGYRIYDLENLTQVKKRLSFDKDELKKTEVDPFETLLQSASRTNYPLNPIISTTTSTYQKTTTDPKNISSDFDFRDKLLNSETEPKQIFTPEEIMADDEDQDSASSSRLSHFKFPTSVIVLASILILFLTVSYPILNNYLAIAQYNEGKPSSANQKISKDSQISGFKAFASNFKDAVLGRKPSEELASLNDQIDKVPVANGLVLAEAAPAAKFLEVNADTRINGTLFGIDGVFSDELVSGTLDTGFGANELYPMDQPVQTTDSPTFSSLSLGTLDLNAVSNQITIGNLTITSATTSTVTATIPTLTSSDSFAFSNNTQTFTNKSLSGSDNTFTNIPNGALSNSKVTVSVSSPLSGGGDVSLGGSVSITLSTVPVSKGGTNLTAYTTGDMIYASATDTLSRLAVGSSGQVLAVSGGIPTWTTIGASGITADSLDFSEFKDAMTLDASTDIATAGFNLTTSGSGNVAFNNTGTFGVAGISTFSANLNANGGFDVDDAFVIADGGVLTTSQAANFNAGLDVDDAFVIADGGVLTTSQTANFDGTLDADGQVDLGDGGDAITLSGTTITLTANTAGNDITFNLVDNNTDALDIQESTNNYINVNTTNSSENISFGNATTNPSFSFLGTGAVTIAGSADGIDALVLTAGDLLISNGDFDLSGGDFNVTLDAGDGVNIAKGAAPTVDVFTINGGTSTTDGVDNLQLTFGVSAASGNVIDITPSYADATAGATSEDYFIIDIDAFTATQNAAGDTGLIRGLNIGNLTQTETAGTLTASALRVGTGWDDILNYNGTTVINGTGQVVSTGITGTLFTAAGDTGSGTIIQGDTLTIAGGTNGIDTAHSGDTITLNFDSTEVGTTTWNAGATDPVWTFNTSGATDPTLTFANSSLTIGSAATIATDQTSLTLFNTTATTINFGGAATTALNIGNGNTAYTAINIGSGTGGNTINLAGTGATGADTINIGTGGTGADTISIGNSASTTAIAFTTGTGNFSITNTQPASVGTTPGTAATAIIALTAATGGNTSIATTGTGGVGSGLSWTLGTGGTAASANTASTGGAGGAYGITAGTGGAAAATGTNVGGAGGAISLTGGTGGAASLGTSNTGGAGGAISITAGSAGSGGNANGGTLTLNSGAITGTGTSTLNLGTSNSTVINIGDSTVSKTIDIGGVTSSDASTISIATEGTAADTIAIGNTNASTTLALTGGDDWSMAATGILTMSASAAQTTAIVITDTDYTNSLSIGDNNITGTTAAIDLTYFDVAATGATTIAPSSNTAALTLTGTNLTSAALISADIRNTTGTLFNYAYGGAVTQGAGTLTGELIDLNTNLTAPAAGQNVTGISLKLPTASTTSNTTVYTGFDLTTAGAITNGTAGSFSWRGASITMPNITQSAGGSVTSSGIVLTTGTITTAGTEYGVNVSAAGVGAGTLAGLNVSNITAGAGAEYGLQIGSGWDRDINFVDTSVIASIGDGGTLTVNDGTNSLCTITDAGTTGNLTCTGNITGSSSGTVGFWSRSSPTLSPATDNDIVLIDSTNTTGADLAVTNTGIYTGTGLVALTANSATTGDILTVSGTALTSGSLAVLTGPSGGTAGVTDAALKITSDVGNIGTSNGLISSTATIDSTANAISGVNLYLNTASSQALATTVGQTYYGLYNTLAKTGADTTSGTITSYGTYSTASNTGGDTAGTRNTYGGYFVATGDTSGTTATYGIYADANAADTSYGVYIDDGAGTTDYGLYQVNSSDDNYFAGNVGIGTTAPTSPLHVVSTLSAAEAINVRSVATFDTARTSLYGIVSDAYFSHTTSTTTNAYAQFNQALYSGTSATGPAVANLIGTAVRTGIAGVAPTGTVTSGQALYIDTPVNNSSGDENVTIATQYGIYIGSQGVNQVADFVTTNSYGLYVAAQSGAATASYAASFAGGNVGIGGDTTPDALLEVGDGTDEFQVDADGDLVFVDADGAASITGPAGGAFSVVAGASQALTLTGANSSTWSTSNGTLTISGDDGLTLTASSTAGITGNFPDNIANALDLQQGSNNYININTTDSSENLAFGNATTNPSFSFLGTGAVTIAGSLDGIDALTLTAGDILVTDGNFDMSGGDFNVNLDDGDSANIDGDGTPTADILKIGNGDTTSSAIDGLEIVLTTAEGASGTNLLNLTPTFASTTNNSTHYAFNIANITATSTTNNLIARAINIGNMTEAGTGTVASSAIRIGTGWDDLLNYNGTTIINSTGGIVGGQVTDDSLDFAQFQDTLDVDATTDINLSTFALTIDLDSTGDFSIRDVTTDIATFADTGAITFAPTSNTNLTMTFAGTGYLSATPTTYTNAKGAFDIVRGGNFTGTAAESAADIKVAPSLTLTEPASGTFTWYGTNIDMSGIAVTAGAGTTALTSLRVAGVSDADAGTVTGVDIANITATAATENALTIGTGWDSDLNFADTSPTVVVANTGTISVTDGTNTLFSIADDTSEGDVTVTGDLVVNGATSADITTSTTTATIFNGTATTLSLGGAATTALNIGNGSGNYTDISIGSGSGTHTINLAGTGATGADTINIGTGGTGADTINIGNSASTTAISFTTGTGNYTITNTQPASVGTTPGTAATAIVTLSAATGGNTSIATTGTGGVGSGLSWTLGTGGTAASANTASTGGAGGAYGITAGTGGAAAATGTNVGGAGGAISLTGGTGGAASGGTSNTGGAGGAISIVSGAAGSGGNANGGTLTLNSGTVTGTGTSTLNIGTANSTILNIGDSTVTKTIDIGGVDSSASDTINLATNGTAADTIAIGNTNASTTLALTGGDDWSMAATGILTMSASASQTTAIVITDTDYTNSLSIGDNTITGTTANIDLTYFDVAGATGAVTIDPQTTGTYLDFTLETAWTSGTLINADFASATTQGADMTGLSLNLNTNLTGAADADVTGINVQTPVLTSSGATTTNYYGYRLSAAGALDTTATGGLTTNINWYGGYIQMPNIDTGEVGDTTTSYGLYIAGGTKTNGAGTENQYGLIIDSSAGNVGIGTTAPSSPLHIYRTLSADQDYAIRSVSFADTAVGGVYGLGIDAYTTNSSGTTTNAYGNFSQALYGSTVGASNTGVSNLHGALYRVGIAATSPTGIVTNAYGSLIDTPANNAGGDPDVTITNNYGLYINNQGVNITSPENDFVTTNSYGLYVAAQSGAATASYAAIFAGGNVGIGTTAPVNNVDFYAAAGANTAFVLRDGDVVNPFTGFTSPITTNAFGGFTVANSTVGGLTIDGYSESDASGFVLRGFNGASDPADTTPSMVFRAYKFDGVNNAVALADAETAYQFQNGTTARVTILGNGNVGIGDTTPSFALDVAGRMAQSTWTADGDTAVYKDDTTGALGVVTSDIRLKKNLTPLQNSLDIISQLTGYTYNEIDEPDGTKKRLGLIAQDLVPILPEATFTFSNETGQSYYSIHYEKLTALLIQGVKELDVKVENIQTTQQFSLDSEGNVTIPELKVGKLTLDSSLIPGGQINEGSINYQLSSLDQRVSGLETGPSFAEMMDEIASVQESHESRVLSLETSSASASAQIAEVNNEISDTRSEISNTNSRVDELKSQILALLNNNSSEASDSGEIADLGLTPPDVMTATGSATLANLDVTEKITALDISTLEMTVSENFKSTGTTDLASTSVAGDFTQDGTFSITGGNSINVIGSGELGELGTSGVLYIQNSPLSFGVDFFNGQVTISKDGTLSAKIITTEQINLVAGKSSGTGRILAGQRTVEIFNPLIKPGSRILVTPTTNTFTVLAVTNKVEGVKFVVSSPVEVSQDINFDWWIINEISSAQ